MPESSNSTTPTDITAASPVSAAEDSVSTRTRMTISGTGYVDEYGGIPARPFSVRNLGEAFVDAARSLFSSRLFRYPLYAVIAIFTSLPFAPKILNKINHAEKTDWPSMVDKLVNDTKTMTRGSTSTSSTKDGVTRVVIIEHDFYEPVWNVKIQENGKTVTPENLQLPPGYRIAPSEEQLEQPKQEAAPEASQLEVKSAQTDKAKYLQERLNSTKTEPDKYSGRS